ncbi:IniB N-terminal domain-containing protein [Georgenia sp. AZ-5]|uniref:IniB N-terminal domain-containing protein n=1 Tax=Georgenia sp. AZ-5 TaxID=3367526 RepID=UPI0037552C73
MTSIPSMLLEFIMNLLQDPKAAEDFRDDPHGTLEAAGLGGICGADVDAVMPVVLDRSPISFDRDYETGGNVSGGRDHRPDYDRPDRDKPDYDKPDRDKPGHDHDKPGHGHDKPGHDHDDDHDHAVQQLHYVLNKYSYTSTVDDRDTIVDQSVNQNIWANGDVTQYFDNELTLASGDGAIAAGGDVDASTTDNSDHSTNVDIEDSEFNIGNTDVHVDDSFNKETDVDIEDSFNDDHSDNSDHSTNLDLEVDDSFNDNSDNSVDNSVDVEDSFNKEVEVEDSFNKDVDIDDSFNEKHTDIDYTDNSDNSVTETDVEIEDSFNKDQSTNVDVELEESFNQDNSTNVEKDVDVDVEDSFNDNSTNTETDVDVEDSFNDNELEA